MSKRNQKFVSKRSDLRLEVLESRQLLATIVGGTGGTEVGSDITVSGKVYDQILMTGQSISVKADPGQIVRVDFMDQDGDILHAEYSGAGTLAISLANFVGATVPTKYNIPATTLVPGYVSGLATFTISGEDASSNFLVTSVGPVTAFNGRQNPIFANGTLTGGNNVANVSRLLLFGDGTTLTGSSMGSIFAGNAVFSDTAGTTGIIAPRVNFVAGSTITIGDIVPLGNAIPSLEIGAASAMTTVKIAGGTLPDLPAGTSSVGYQAALFGPGVTNLISTSGTNSKGTSLPTQALANNPSGAIVTYDTSGIGTVTIDGSTATTASLDALYKKAFLADVIINNGLRSGVTFHAYQFGNVTVNGDLAGVITTDSNDDNQSGNPEQGIASITVNGNILDGGYIESATSIGSVTVTGAITHTVAAPTATVFGSPVPLALGVITTLGRYDSSAAIGPISIGGNITDTAAESFVTANRSTSALTSGIASISAGSLIASAGSSPLAIIGSLGTSVAQGIGNLNFAGDVSLTGGAGGIVSSQSVGNISARSLTLNTNSVNGIVANASTGSIGNITTSGGNLTLTSGQISAGTSIGNISLTSFGNATIGQSISAGTNIGNITLDSGTLTTTAAITAGGTGLGNIGAINVKSGNLSVDANIVATGGNIGAISVKNSTATAVIGVTHATTIQATVDPTTLVGGTVGGISVTSVAVGVTGSLSLGTGANTGSILGAAIGDISVGSGNFVFATAGSKIVASNASGDAWQGTSIGNVTVTGGGIVGATGNVEFQANKIGNVSVTGNASTSALLTDVIFQAKGTTAATIGTAKIGNITLDSSANTSGDIAAAAANAASSAATDDTHGTGFSSSGNIGNITITTGGGAGAEVVSTGIAGANHWGSLIFRAGSSNLGLATAVTNNASALAALAGGSAVNFANFYDAATTKNVEAVSIGNVTISAKVVGGNLSAGNAPGTGLVIASGVNVITNGTFESAAAAGSTLVVPAALTSGTIGNLTINDQGGSVVRTPFSSTSLISTGAGTGGGSIIIADQIASITVNAGLGAIISSGQLAGAPVAGAIGNVTSLGATPVQAFAGGNADNLVLVVL